MLKLRERNWWCFKQKMTGASTHKVCVCVCVYTRADPCVCARACVCVCVCARVHVCMRACMWVWCNYMCAYKLQTDKYTMTICKGGAHTTVRKKQVISDDTSTTFLHDINLLLHHHRPFRQNVVFLHVIMGHFVVLHALHNSVCWCHGGGGGGGGLGHHVMWGHFVVLHSLRNSVYKRSRGCLETPGQQGALSPVLKLCML